MIGSKKHKSRKSIEFTYPVLIAQKFVRLFEEIKSSSDEQQSILAAAYYSLGTQQNLSFNKSKMYINAAITTLNKIGIINRKENWNSQIAHAYFKRAEILEEKQKFITATYDYNKAIDVLEQFNETCLLDDEDRLLLAQSAISIADLIVNEQIEDKELPHPLFYVNKALEHLGQISNYDDDIWATHAYAHQIAGIALSPHHFEEAKEAFRIALLMAFKTDSINICPLLADIYTCLGLLHEQYYQQCPIEKMPDTLLHHAMAYFGLSLLFSPIDREEQEEEVLGLESLFEMIYKILDPYISPVSLQLTCDVVDALIYAYLCILDGILPNRVLDEQLKFPDTIDMYAQHIYWLVIEAYYKRCPRVGLIEIMQPNKVELTLERSDILNRLQNIRQNNVFYLQNIVK